MNEAAIELEDIFNKFSSNYECRHLTNDQSKNLQQWREIKKSDGITLSQVDNWFYHAELIPSFFGKSKSGEVFFRFKYDKEVYEIHL